MICFSTDVNKLLQLNPVVNICKHTGLNLANVRLSAQKRNKYICTFLYCHIISVEPQEDKTWHLRMSRGNGRDLNFVFWLRGEEITSCFLPIISAYVWTLGDTNLGCFSQTCITPQSFVICLHCVLQWLQTAEFSSQSKTHTVEALCQFLWMQELNFALFYRKSKICYSEGLLFPAVTITVNDQFPRMCHILSKEK